MIFHFVGALFCQTRRIVLKVATSAKVRIRGYSRLQLLAPAREHLAASDLTLSLDAFPERVKALLNAYKKKLIQDGVAPADAEQVVANLRKYAAGDSGFSTLFYKKEYAKRNPMHATGPNAFLVEIVQKLRSGRAIELGMVTCEM